MLALAWCAQSVHGARLTLRLRTFAPPQARDSLQAVQGENDANLNRLMDKLELTQVRIRLAMRTSCSPTPVSYACPDASFLVNYTPCTRLAAFARSRASRNHIVSVAQAWLTTCLV